MSSRFSPPVAAAVTEPPLSSRPSSRQPIAVVGLAGRFPGARSLDELWENLRAGVDALQDFSDADLDAAGVDSAMRAHPNWVRRGTVLEGADLFDAAFFGYAPREAQVMDPQQRVFLETAWEALEHAGYAGEPEGVTVGVYAGASMNTYFVSLLADRELLASVGGYQLMLANDKDFLCTRVSYKLDLHGPSLTIQTACSTSLVAVQTACQALQRGECDMALAGGVSISFPERSGYPYQEGMIFSPDGTCRPFDAEAKGTRSGAGAGIVVLKRLSEALADGDTIHAVILGAAINNDGAGKAGYTAPSVDGQVEAIATAQALAGVDPRTISYVEAHGTATPLGDPIEVAALTRVFRASTPDQQFCALGSLKANLGHLDAAAGVAGLIKTVLALKHRELPPLPHFRAPNPALGLATSPFRIPTAAEPWAAGETPRRAGVSSFGIGGTNAHVVLEEAPAATPAVATRDRHLLVLSARTAEALDAATANLAEHLRAHPDVDIADVAHTLQVGRRAFAHRRAVVVRDVADAVAKLSSADQLPASTHEGGARPVAFLFSGQGSQHAGMARELYRTERVFREAVDQCAELLVSHLGRDVRELLASASDAELSETSVAQPLLFVVEYALATLWMSWGVQPAAMLGHSVGEYVAAHLAGVFTLDDALRLVAARGRLMQALPAGAMLAVSLPAAEVRRAWLRPGVEVAAENAPELCTVSGEPEAVEALARELAEAGVEHRALHTSHAFHSAMMEPALAPFREVVSSVTGTPPRRRYVSNVTGTWIRHDEATSAEYWVRHLRGCVRFADGVSTLAADPSLLLLEVGPGTTLTSLARLGVGRDGAARVVSSLPHPREARGDVEAVLAAAGRLWTAGVPLDWAAMHADEVLHRVPLPTYPFERKRYRVEPKAAAQTPAAASAPARSASVEDWFHAPTWTRAALPRTGGKAVDGTWLVFGRGDALADAVASGLRARGASVVLVEEGTSFAARGDDHYLVRPDSADDHAALLRELERLDARPRGAVHLWNAGPTDAAPRTHARTYALHALAALGRALLTDAATATLRLLVATTGAQSVLGEPVAAPTRALANGPVLVLPLEHEGVDARAVDLEPSHDAERAAVELLEELTADDGESFVARRGGLRWVRRYLRTTLPTADAGLPLRDGGRYLVTGGLGGIGLTLAEWLAGRVSARLVLTARTPLPPRESWDAWLAEHPADDATALRIASVRRIEAAGGEVIVAVADAADRAGMQRAVELAREAWGGIDGVVHAAGIAGDGLLALSTPDESDAVLTAKVDGTSVLVGLLGDTPLDFVLLCSSVNVVGGVAGTFAYTAANAYLDAFALSSSCPPGWRALSIAWDAWRDVGMATKVVVPKAMRAARQAYVDAGIAPRDGAEAFARALAAGQPQYVVSPYDVQQLLTLRQRARRAEAAARVERAAAAPERPERPDRVARAQSSSFAPPSGEVEERLAAMWQELLGVDAVGADDDFFELGGHSLLATRVLSRVESQFGVRLSLRTVFDAPTLRQLAAAIVAEREGEAVVGAAAAPSGDREEFEL